MITNVYWPNFCADLRTVTFWTQMKKVCLQFWCFRFSAMLSAGSDQKKKKQPKSLNAQMRLAGHLDGNNTHQWEQHRIQQIICTIFWTKLTSYSICTIAAKLNLKLHCSLKDLWIRSNAEIVSFELIVKTSVAGDIQSSSRQNSGGCQLVLKPLHWGMKFDRCVKVFVYWGKYLI